MILPIFALGQPVLKQVAKDITAEYEGLSQLIEDMWETMYQAYGVGLAAPQIGLGIRMFVVDSTQIKDEMRKGEKGIKKVFINAQVIEESGKSWSYEEGCLSIPHVRGEVERLDTVRIKYMDENFVEFEETYSGINARVIQHEYDHIDGILFTDKLKPLKKKLIQRRMNDITAGKVRADYKLKFAKSR
jgi:peptide deformylase